MHNSGADLNSCLRGKHLFRLNVLQSTVIVHSILTCRNLIVMLPNRKIFLIASGKCMVSLLGLLFPPSGYHNFDSKLEIEMPYIYGLTYLQGVRNRKTACLDTQMRDSSFSQETKMRFREKYSFYTKCLGPLGSEMYCKSYEMRPRPLDPIRA